MPKVNKIERAGKDYPQFGIKKGEPHYVWSIKMQRGGIVRRSKTYPRPSQLTLSEYKVQAHLLNERIEDFDSDVVADIEAFRDELVEEAGNLRDEQQEKLDAMPEGLQQSQTGEIIQERIDALEAFISELEDLEFEEFEPADEQEAEDDSDPVNDDGHNESEHGQEQCQKLKDVQLDVN